MNDPPEKLLADLRTEKRNTMRLNWSFFMEANMEFLSPPQFRAVMGLLDADDEVTQEVVIERGEYLYGLPVKLETLPELSNEQGGG